MGNFRALALVGLAACKFAPNVAGDAAPPGDAGDPDAIDAFIPQDGAADASGICIGSFVEVCVPADPPDRNNFPGAGTYDTDVAANCDLVAQGPVGPAACIVLAHNMTVTGTLRAVGSRVLVLAVFNDFTLKQNVEIDVSSNITGAGASANDGSCASTTIAGTNGALAAGGGAGGTHQGLGGRGAAANTGTAFTDPAGQVTAWTFVRGGCPGGHGGNTDLDTGGLGGAGGGAILIIAKAKLKLEANAGISASGAGGAIGGLACGGGGGGSGGFIGLDGANLDIAVDARIIANGGGGASGTNETNGGAARGEDGKDTADAATGGAGVAAGGGGSNLAQLGGGDGMPGGALEGGGAGGGGAGVILVPGAMPSAGIFSPGITIP